MKIMSQVSALLLLSEFRFRPEAGETYIWDRKFDIREQVYTTNIFQ
jgi:hypothetical protein